MGSYGGGQGDSEREESDGDSGCGQEMRKVGMTSKRKTKPLSILRGEKGVLVYTKLRTLGRATDGLEDTKSKGLFSYL